jgi:hypothetical protein
MPGPGLARALDLRDGVRERCLRENALAILPIVAKLS